MATGAGRVEIGVLGPLRVRGADGSDITPSGGLQRRLLALLVQCRGEVVSADAAVDVLWPSAPPQDATAALQNHLSRLRRALPDGAIESVGSGYRLDPTQVVVDADRLVDLLGGGLDDAAAGELTLLLQRWQGPAYPELDDAELGRAETTRLEELRIRAREAIAEARLAAGDTDGLVGDLIALAIDEPLRERPRSLLMATLAATGRVAEATRAYDDFRRLLGEELGIEPSAALAAQHAALLQGTTGSAAGIAPRGLPVLMTELVGRDALLDELAESLDAARVVTLLGPGGIGKTRLLLELGHRLQRQRPDRAVVLCELAAAEPASTAEVVMAAMGIDSRPGTAPSQRIVDVLGDDEVVLLLDNCEHVLGPIAELAEEAVGACPNVTVVATSRERLRIPGEVIRAVPTLLGDDGGVDPAVDLFVRRARAVRGDFAPTEGEWEQIAEVVRRLDGLPLAIELAAARLHTHDLAELAEGLDQPLSLLVDGYRNSSRHSSLAAVVAWSYGMLEPGLQEAFASLSVFARPFTAEAAAAVCQLDGAEAARHLSQLVERSLVVRAPGRRYVLLETLRAFGAEQLLVSGQNDLVRERHARWFLAWAERTAARLHDPGYPAVVQIDEAVPELRATLTWLLDHGLVAQAARLVAHLITYGLLRLRPDVLAWAHLVIEADPEDASPAAPIVWAAAGYHAWMAGDLQALGEASVRAVEAAERHSAGVPQEAATIRGNHGLFEGQLDSAIEWYQRGADAARDDTTRLIALGAQLLAHGYASHPEAIELGARLLREIGEAETAVASYVWYCVGESELALGSDQARLRLARAVELADLTNASFVKGVAGASKASIEVRTGDPAVAAADYRWLIPHWQRAGMWSTQWTMLRSIVVLLERIGRPRDAAVLEGAIRAPGAGHRIFGADEVALGELSDRLRAVLGDDDYEAALLEGGELDGHGAAELALRCLDVEGS